MVALPALRRFWKCTCQIQTLDRLVIGVVHIAERRGGSRGEQDPEPSRQHHEPEEAPRRVTVDPDKPRHPPAIGVRAGHTARLSLERAARRPRDPRSADEQHERQERTEPDERQRRPPPVDPRHRSKLIRLGGRRKKIHGRERRGCPTRRCPLDIQAPSAPVLLVVDRDRMHPAGQAYALGRGVHPDRDTTFQHRPTVDGHHDPVVAAGVEVEVAGRRHVPVAFPTQGEKTPGQLGMCIEDRQVERRCDSFETHRPFVRVRTCQIRLVEPGVRPVGCPRAPGGRQRDQTVEDEPGDSWTWATSAP